MRQLYSVLFMTFVRVSQLFPHTSCTPLQFIPRCFTYQLLLCILILLSGLWVRGSEWKPPVPISPPLTHLITATMEVDRSVRAPLGLPADSSTPTSSGSHTYPMFHSSPLFKPCSFWFSTSEQNMHTRERIVHWTPTHPSFASAGTRRPHFVCSTPIPPPPALPAE